jgi:hypothetical protein
MAGTGAKAGRGRKAASRGQDRADAGPDQVICLLCGDAYRAVGVTHLRARHGFEGPHPVEDYKVEFGLRVAACRDVCRTLAERRIERAVRDGRHWTRARILRELRQRARAGESVASSSLGVAMSLAIRRLFGSWERAIRRAGLDPDAHRLTTRWDGRRLEKAIRARQAAGRPLSSTSVKAEQPKLHHAAIRRHGGWEAALRAAGLDPKVHRMVRKWSLPKAREWVLGRHAKGLPITAGHVPTGLHGRVCHAIKGGWTSFVESLGIRYPGVKKRRWTDADVLAEIRSLRRRGRPLNARAVRDAGGGALEDQARKRFGSWDRALLAAGVDPGKTRLAAQWSRARVLETIRARHAAGKTLERPRVREQDKGLLRAAEKYFGGGWPEALRAARLGPRRRGRGGS